MFLYLLAVAFLLFIWIFRKWVFNAHYFLAVVVDALKDITCQLWIDIEKFIYRIKKFRAGPFDERFNGAQPDPEDFYHRD